MEDLSLTLLDLIQNSIRAKAKEIIINIKLNEKRECFISVIDDGIGFKKEDIDKLSSPFYTTKPTKVAGLGLAFVKQLADICGGCFCVERIDNKTIIHFSYLLNCVDRPVFGKIEDSIYSVLTSYPDLDILLTIECIDFSYSFSTKLIKKELEIETISNNFILDYIYKDLKEGLKKLKEVDLNEIRRVKSFERKVERGDEFKKR